MPKKVDQKLESAGRSGRLNAPKSPNNRKVNTGSTPDFDVCCPNCQVKGDFLQDVNKVLKNCIDFCEFPHRCPQTNNDGPFIWKTLGELQAHA
jgi:hypothetical protein